jgi:hypothetical protein
VTVADWIALALVALTAVAGLRRGLIVTGLSVAGLFVGAYVGARIGAAFLSHGAQAQYTAFAALLGAAIGAALIGAVASSVGRRTSRSVDGIETLRFLDSAGGLVAGAAWGLLIVWVAGAVALELPGQASLRRSVQRSAILQRLYGLAPPSDLLNVLARLDPWPIVVGPLPPSLPPDRHLLSEPAVQHAASSVVRVTAEACGLGVEGTGWVAAPHRVVTAAHVVSGASDISAGGDTATAWAIDRKDDIAVLDVPGLAARPLPLGQARTGQAVAILGFPENGPFDARAGRIGPTETALLNGTARQVTVFSGLVRHGNSGSPAVDDAGVVRTTVFAGSIGGPAGGYGVPSSAVRAALATARQAVSTGGC